MGAESRFTRRQFLELSAAAVTGIVAPAFVPSSALGRNGWIAPSERITMGFIGIGGQGAGHLLGGAWTYLAGGYTARPDVQVLAVCDVWRERRDNARDRVNEHYSQVYEKGTYRSCESYMDFRNILERPDIDAVVIASPAHWHATMTTLAARAGKDVYCEKPTAVTIRESQEVAAAVRRHACIYQAGTQQRSEYNGLFRKACEFVRNGRIGTLREIYAWRDGGAIAWPRRFGPAQQVPQDLEWDLYLGPAPDFAFDGDSSAHRFDIGELNWGQHHYDVVQWATGSDATGPVELWTEVGRSHYRYASGVTVYGKPYPGEKVGDQGGAVFVGTEGRIAVDRDRIVAYPSNDLLEPLHSREEPLYMSHSHSGNFLECVRTRQKTICDADTAHRSASALLLGGIVKQLEGRLHWDPERETFPDQPEANRLLSIAKRAPWTT